MNFQSKTPSGHTARHVARTANMKLQVLCTNMLANSPRIIPFHGPDKGNGMKWHILRHKVMGSQLQQVFSRLPIWAPLMVIWRAGGDNLDRRSDQLHAKPEMMLDFVDRTSTNPRRVISTSANNSGLTTLYKHKCLSTACWRDVPWGSLLSHYYHD